VITDHKLLLWFKNAQDANMRIFRWRLKLTENEYDVVYKTDKTNVNADTLSRNPVIFEEADCNIIKHNKTLNPDNTENAEIISKNVGRIRRKWRRQRFRTVRFRRWKKLTRYYQMIISSWWKFGFNIHTRRTVWTETTNYRKSINSILLNTTEYKLETK